MEDNDLNIHVGGQSSFILPSLELCLLSLTNGWVGLNLVQRDHFDLIYI